jgi:hypothetical protein
LINISFKVEGLLKNLIESIYLTAGNGKSNKLIRSGPDLFLFLLRLVKQPPAILKPEVIRSFTRWQQAIYPPRRQKKEFAFLSPCFCL